MSETEVKKVYETLSGVETKLNKAEAYPIHKRLNFGENSELKDAYDWIAKHIDLPTSGNVLVISFVAPEVGFNDFISHSAFSLEI